MTCPLVTVCLALPVTPDNLEQTIVAWTLLPQGDTPLNSAGEGEGMLSDDGETLTDIFVYV